MLLTGIRPASVRFAFSPLQEVLRALGVFVDPRVHAEQMPWVRKARRRTTPPMKREIRRFDVLLKPVPELFPELLPLARDATLDDELRLVRASARQFNASVVRRMLGKTLVDRREIERTTKPAGLRRLARSAAERDPNRAAFFDAFAESPSRVRRDLCACVEAFYERCLAGEWAELHARAVEDAQARERLLRRFGIAAMLRTLTRELTVAGDEREASLAFGGAASAGVRLALGPDATLALTPSYFSWPHASVVVLRRGRIDVRIAYPLVSPSTRSGWSTTRHTTARRFAALGDPVRLEILALLGDRQLSTRELAGFLGLSEGGVSRHLAVLREAGFVSSARDGYFVLYRRSPNAEALLRAATGGGA